ncbi:MAG: lipid-binding SYLF domain-containing protein [Verrucomicrobiales bacterium]|jgi:lipid-binding SYLF domain-containing protein|nr:lipid-binding SYLF domain-containing protein [Verrucomicrobiales bacterium]
MKTSCLLLCLALALTVSVRAEPASVIARVNTAIGILRVKQSSATPIPQQILADAKGVAIISVSQGGFIFGGRHGEGIIVTRTRGALGPSWSAPLAFSLSGGSFGAQIGYQTLHYVFVLNSDAAVRTFLSGGEVQWNAAAQGTAGPDHAGADTDPAARAAVYIYTQSDGVYGGATIGGTTLRTDNDINRVAYGDTPLADLVAGQGVRPREAAKLYELLNGQTE